MPGPGSSGTARILFVTGLHRSGTSMLARTLATSPHVHPMTGTGAPQDEGQHVQTVVTSAAAHGGPGLFAFDPGAHLTEVDAASGAAERIWREWRRYWPQRLSRGDVLLEKSPPTILRTRYFAHLFPDARFAVIRRHPSIVAASTHWWRPELAADTLVRHWLVAHERYFDDRTHLRRTHELRYEDLVAAPVAGLARLAADVEVTAPFDVSEISAGRTRRHVATWRRLSARCAASTWRDLEPRLQRFGYSFDPPYVLPHQ